jgi:DNA-binding NarL/FixJ family response regulator
MTIRILLVDDHTVVRKGLRTFLKYDPELEVVGEAADGAEALIRARELKPDVVVMDLLMPGWTALSPLPRSGVKCLRSRCWLSPAS